MNSLKETAKKLKSKILQLQIALYSNQTPILAKGVALVTITYALSPIDLIPDFIPILGYLDDLIILPLLIYVTIKLIPKELWQQFELEAMQTELKVIKKWYYAIPILLFWVVLFALIIYEVMK